MLGAIGTARRMKRMRGRINHFLRINGIDATKIYNSLRFCPRYIRDYFAFKRTLTNSGHTESSLKIQALPVLGDWCEDSGDMSSEYFLADLYAARRVYRICRDSRVLDIGSRIDGLVAHLAVFRQIDVLDIRENNSCLIENIDYRQGDITRKDCLRGSSKYDVVTSVHALEHFGLGRYGDKIDPSAPWKALKNIADHLTRGGTLILGVPVGTARIQFNSQRVFSPSELIDRSRDVGIEIKKVALVSEGRMVEHQIRQDLIRELENISYTFAVFSGERVW